MTDSYDLNRHLDSAAAPPLARDLMALRGKPLCVDASAVTFGGALALQVLVAARKQWDEDAHGFRIAPLSTALANAASGMGIALSDLGASSDDVIAPEDSQ